MDCTFLLEKPETTIAAASAVIALVATAFTAHQAFLTRQHNRLSVKPHLTTWSHEENNGAIYKLETQLLNNGLGPAVLKRFIVFFEGKIIGDNRDRQSLEEKIEEVITSQQNIIRHSISIIGLSFPIPSQTKEVLLSISVPMAKDTNKKTYIDFMNKFDIKLVYQSMYGENFSFDTREEKQKIYKWFLERQKWS